MIKKNPYNIKKDTVQIKETKETKEKKEKKEKKETKEFAKYPKKQYDTKQIKELLEGYIEVSNTKWNNIPVGSHIRYIKTDGSFVRGGFVTNHWINAGGKLFTHLTNNLNKNTPGYATWPMAHESVSRIFKKPDAKSSIEIDLLRGKIKEMILQITKLAGVVKHQGRRIEVLENRHK
jgi:hypothetical protein